MDSRTANLYLSRILSGFFVFWYKNTNYKLVYPDIHIKYDAEIYANNEYENNKFNDWVTDDELLYTLIDLGIWTHDGDNHLKNLEKQIEDTKINLYKNFLNPTKIKSFRRTLENYKKSYNKLFDARHSLDHVTASGYSNLLKNQYIVIHSLYDINNNKLFDRIEDVDPNFLNDITNIISQNYIDISTFRSIARNDIWKNYWGANKDFLFDKPTINWTDEQRTLVMLTKMYDSAYEHPDCPTDGVFEDDDMFDGWMIIQKRENEKNKSKSRAEKMFDGKLSKAQEVYVMAGSKDEAENIYNLNDQNSQFIIKERNSVVLNSNAFIEEANLPDVQRNLITENNKKFMEGKKK